MSATDAKPIPRKGEAFRAYFTLETTAGVEIAGATGLDSEVSKDGGAFADCTNETTEVAQGLYYLDITLTEMTADATVVVVKSTTANAKKRWLFIYPEEVGDIRANVTAFGDKDLTADGDIPFWTPEQGTAQSLVSNVLTIRGPATIGDGAFNGYIVLIKGSGGATYWQARQVRSSVGDAFTLDSPLAVAVTGTISYKFFAVPASNIDAGMAVLTTLGLMISGGKFTPEALENGFSSGQAGISGAASSGTTTKLISPVLDYPDNHWQWQMLRIKDGVRQGKTALIISSNQSEKSVTFYPAFPGAVTTDNFEILPGTIVNAAMMNGVKLLGIGSEADPIRTVNAP